MPDFPIPLKSSPPQAASNAGQTAGVICVIGMHRSGSSIITRLLNLCGLDLGPADQLFGPHESNPLGHFEHHAFLDINDALLAHFGGSWDDPPALQPGWEHAPELEPITRTARSLTSRYLSDSPWGWKDPRTSLLLPFWKMLVPNLRFVICVRNPFDVAQSLSNRNGIPLPTGIYLWHEYTRAAIRDTEGSLRLFICYDRLMKDPSTETRRLLDFCRLTEPRKFNQVLSVISPGLQHWKSQTAELLKLQEVPAEYTLFYLALRGLLAEDPVDSDCAAASAGAPLLLTILDHLHGDHKIPQLESAPAAMRAHVESLERLVEQQRHQLNAIHNSKAWKLVAWYWRAANNLRGFRPRITRGSH